MAKSIRSKRKRKMRRIKRERYSVKEMRRLKIMLGVNDDDNKEHVAVRVSQIAKVVDHNNLIPDQVSEKTRKRKFEEEANTIKCVYNVKDVQSDSESSGEEDDVELPILPAVQDTTGGEIEMDTSQKRIFNPKTKKDQYGTYPIWFTQENIRRQKAKEKNRKTKLKRLNKAEEKLRLWSNGLRKNSKAKKSRKAVKKSKSILKS